MEKLLNLLNEYEPGNMPITKIEGQGIDLVISKRLGFIKWLVENDKINKDIISRVLIRAYVSPKNHVSLECEFYDYYESLLMLLSISDSPIEDLISYLK